MGKEFEKKYRALPGDLDRIRSVYAGEYGEIPMTTTYYDTPDRALAALRWTLRHRQEGPGQVCTLKTPGDDRGRGEWEVECPRIQDAIPLLLAQGAPAELEVLTRQGLIPTCGARFLRRCRRISGDGFEGELALDSGVLLGGSREAALCEVELELKSGSRRALADFAQRFAEEFGLEPEPESKFARAAALAKEG